MEPDTKTAKTREDLAKWTSAELFAYAVTHGFSHTLATSAKPGRNLSYSYCYGIGYSDTKFWDIPYELDEAGLPVFDQKAKDMLIMLFTGEHLKTWHALKGANGTSLEARKAHDAFMAS